MIFRELSCIKDAEIETEKLEKEQKKFSEKKESIIGMITAIEEGMEEDSRNFEFFKRKVAQSIKDDAKDILEHHYYWKSDTRSPTGSSMINEYRIANITLFVHYGCEEEYHGLADAKFNFDYSDDILSISDEDLKAHAQRYVVNKVDSLTKQIDKCQKDYDTIKSRAEFLAAEIDSLSPVRFISRASKIREFRNLEERKMAQDLILKKLRKDLDTYMLGEMDDRIYAQLKAAKDKCALVRKTEQERRKDQRDQNNIRELKNDLSEVEKEIEKIKYRLKSEEFKKNDSLIKLGASDDNIEILRQIAFSKDVGEDLKYVAVEVIRKLTTDKINHR